MWLSRVLHVRPLPRPGGGGGGQIQIMAIGTIKIGSNGLIMAKGGNGIAGESTGWTYGQISGSGGGSGGHIILHSATGLDLRDINLGNSGATLFDEHKNYVMGINDSEERLEFGGVPEVQWRGCSR